jgi:hypothetical protein
MRDLSNIRWIKAKGFLFLLLGVSLWLYLLLKYYSLEFGLLFTLVIWCFCRFYYFAFYVIEHYVDPSYRFSGLLSFTRYMAGRRE